MGRTTYKQVHLGKYNKCSFCGYEVRNNRVGMRLHIKYSHPNVFEKKIEVKNRTLCGVCKKYNCRNH